MKPANFRSQRRPQRVAALPAGLLIACGGVFANADAERETLARLIHEIHAIAALIATAESQASPDGRIRFRYDWLRQDLRRMRLGIEEHINAPRAEPRSFPPPRGDYRR